LFELRNCYELYHDIQARIASCDREEEELLKQFESRNKDGNVDNSKLSLKSKRLKNQHTFNVATYCQQYTGVDLFAINGVKHQTVMTFISEVGMDIFKFRLSKAFVSWLRLSPNNKISGGKTLSSRTPKGKNKRAIALRNAANSVGSMKEGSLKRFFDRIADKKGRAAAVTATARKLAEIIWNMVIHQTPYKPIDEHQYNERIRNSIIQNIKKKMSRMNLNINDLMTPQEIS
jgi:transposase